MTTALQIINRATELIGYKDPVDSLSGADAASFLATLNGMLGTWNTQRLFVPCSTTVTATVTTSPVSIGTGQTLSTTRPTRIEAAWVRENGVDRLLDPLSVQQYDAIANKAASGIPTHFLYAPTVPYGSVYLWPVPTSSVVYVRVASLLSEFANLATEYDLAAGYRRALEYSLAEELAPGMRPLDPLVARMAMTARRAIKVANFEPLMFTTSDVAGHRVFDIVTGQ